MILPVSYKDSTLERYRNVDEQQLSINCKRYETPAPTKKYVVPSSPPKSSSTKVA
jgi:hypothetical protein